MPNQKKGGVMDANYSEKESEVERKMQRQQDRADGIGKYPEE